MRQRACSAYPRDVRGRSPPEPKPERYGPFRLLLNVDGGVWIPITRIDGAYSEGAGATFGIGVDRPLASFGASSAAGVFARVGGAVATGSGGASGSPDWLLVETSFQTGAFVATDFVSFRTGLGVGLWRAMPDARGAQTGTSLGLVAETVLHPRARPRPDGPARKNTQRVLRDAGARDLMEMTFGL